MALNDQNLVFSTAQAVTATAASTNTYDIQQGLMVTTTFTPTPNQIIGNATYFGEDLGLGRGKGTPAVEIFSGSGTPAAATSLQIQFRGAPMNSTAFGTGNVADLTFVAYIETRAIPLASILASSRLAAFDWPRREVAQAMPRFVNLNYIVAGSNFTGLTLTALVNLGGTSAQDTLGQYASNF